MRCNSRVYLISSIKNIQTIHPRHRSIRFVLRIGNSYSLNWIARRFVVRRIYPAFGTAVCFLGILFIFGLRAYGQDIEQRKAHPNGIVEDWSRRYAVYPRVGPIHSLIALRNDPRAVLSWQEAARKDWHRWRIPHRDRPPQSSFHTDWSISLGMGSTAPAMYPAKFSFDVTATPDCANDFVVFPVDVSGSTSQPNIVGFNNLYSGSTPSTGICNTRTVQGGTTDDVTSATVLWSYYINSDIQTNPGSPVNFARTSPALSLDGTKVAFVISGSYQYGDFVVLAPKSGDGVATDLQTVTAPVSISVFAPTAVAANSGTATNLLLDYDSDLSSPFIDYQTDTAYVGDRYGDLYHILNVFCTTTACQTGGTPAPSLDPVWGGFAGLSVPCGLELTDPVVDAFSNVFVGCADGRLYGFNSSGTPLAGSPITVGDGSATGGIVDPPVVDVVNGYLYVATGNSAGGTSVVAQIQDLGSSISLVSTATLDAGGVFNLHAPAFNDAYFTDAGTPGNWLLYEYSGNNNSTTSVWGIGFSTGRVMNTGTPSNLDILSSGSFEASPLTEFFSGTTDYLFAGNISSSPGNSGVSNYDITGGTFPTSSINFAAEGQGTSGIIVDNNSGSAQASSIYFGVLGTGTNANSAVKLTQSGLQ